MSEKSEIERVLDNWEIDSKIDNTEYAKELNKIPNLHSKYIRVMMVHSSKMKKLQYDMMKLRKWKSDYYNGRMPKEELAQRNLQPYKFILKTEAKDYIDADDDVMALSMRLAAHEEIVTLCQSIIRELNNRGYNLKAAAEWERFIAGS